MGSPSNTSIPQAAQRALDRAAMLHLRDPNVSLIDLGFRIRDRQGYRIEEELCVRVHLRWKPYGEAFGAFATRYPERVVRPERVGFAVDVPQADYSIQWWPWYRPAPSRRRGGVFSPLRGGISVSNAWKIGYGTLGGKVIDRETEADMILSNWHVLVGSWYVPPDAPIYQPGRWHGGRCEHTVARLTRDGMERYIDAAVARLTGARPLTNDQLGLGPVTGAGAPRVGMRVTKSGCGSGVTTGMITGLEGRRVEHYHGVRRVIRHTVHIARTPAGGEVSRRGDSGSWWLEEETRRAVGLHFAGSDVPEYGVAIAMPQVLDALNVRI